MQWMAVSSSSSVHNTEVHDPKVQVCILLACIPIHACILLYMTEPVVKTSFIRALVSRADRGLTPRIAVREWDGCLAPASGSEETHVYSKFTSLPQILGCSRRSEDCRLAKLGKALCDCNTCHMAYSAGEEEAQAKLRRYVAFRVGSGVTAETNFPCQMGGNVFKPFTKIEVYVL